VGVEPTSKQGISKFSTCLFRNCFSCYVIGRGYRELILLLVKQRDTKLMHDRSWHWVNMKRGWRYVNSGPSRVCRALYKIHEWDRKQPRTVI